MLCTFMFLHLWIPRNVLWGQIEGYENKQHPSDNDQGVFKSQPLSYTVGIFLQALFT